MKIMNYLVIKTKVIGRFKKETPKNFSMDEFVALRSKMYAFKGGNDSKNNKKELAILIRKILNLKNIKNV